MSFAAPLRLLGLALVPVLLAGYVVHQRRRRRVSAGFVSPALIDSVAPWRPGWRRNVPVLVLGLALATLIAAAARPQRTAAQPVRSAAIMLANDVSSSMMATDVRPTRLTAARRAAQRLLAGVAGGVLVGQLAFARRVQVLQEPSADHALTHTAIDQLRPGGGGTAIGDAITTALHTLSAVPRRDGMRLPGTIVLLSDGASNVGLSPIPAARRARLQHVAIDTIALGTAAGRITITHAHRRRVTPVPVAFHELAQIAAASGGRAYRAASSATARAVYAGLATALSHRRVTRGLTAAFAGGGLALLVLSGGLSLAWFGRVA